MSFLYLKGLKQGDTQMTVFGLMIAGLFFTISQSKPLNKLSVQKPPSSVFEPSVICSIIGQSSLHIACLYATSLLCGHYALLPKGVAADAPANKELFYPNIINTAIFLVTSTIQVNNFVINYYGHPYMQSITENVLLYRAVAVIYVVLLVLIGGQIEPLNDLFELVDFTRLRPVTQLSSDTSCASEFQGYLLAIMLSSVGIGWCIEHLSRKLEKNV